MADQRTVEAIEAELLVVIGEARAHQEAAQARIDALTEERRIARQNTGCGCTGCPDIPSMGCVAECCLPDGWPEATALHAVVTGHVDHCGIHYSAPGKPMCACTCGADRG